MKMVKHLLQEYKVSMVSHPSLQTMIHIVRVSCFMIDLLIVMHMLNYPHVADMYKHMYTNVRFTFAT